jgi:hypothetical protein
VRDVGAKNFSGAAVADEVLESAGPKGPYAEKTTPLEYKKIGGFGPHVNVKG